MHDDIRILAAFLIAPLLVGACAKREPPAKAASVTAAAAAPTSAVPGDSVCTPTGEWAECSVLYRLDQAGVAPRLDSTATVEEPNLHGQSFVVKIGRIAKLEAFLYPDSSTRIADGRKLDRTQLVNGTAPQTMRRERTLIENGNLIGLLTSLDEHQRERVSDALTAGAPQPPTSTP